MSDVQIRHICLHELAHLKNGDLIVMQILNILNILYWFNPLVWICFNMVRKDMECVCDQKGIQTLGQDGRKDYAGTVLQICSTGGGRLRAAISMNDGRCDMEKMIRNMYRKNSTGKKAKAIIRLLIS